MKKILLLSIILFAGQMAGMQPRQPRNFYDLNDQITNLSNQMRWLEVRLSKNPGLIEIRRKWGELAADLYEIVDARLREIGPLPTWNNLIERFAQVKKNRRENWKEWEMVVDELKKLGVGYIACSPKEYLEVRKDTLCTKDEKLRREIGRLEILVNIGANKYNSYRNMILPYINDRNRLYRKVRDIIQERQERRRGAMERNFTRRR